MATKPSTWPLIWCSNAVFLTGPFIGSPGKVVIPGGVAAEGHRPGALYPTAAEYENWNGNLITTALTDWVRLGSSAGAADAHIVETDGTGRATLHGLTVNNTTTQTAIFATGNAALLPVYRATNSAGGDGFLAALSGSTGSAFTSALTGDSIGLELTQAGDSVAIMVTADGTATQACVAITQAGSGKGINVLGGSGDTAIEATAGAGQIAGDFIGDAASVHALRAIGGTLRAVFGVGIDGGRGGEFLAGSTAAEALLATGVDPDAVGVHGRTSTSASATASGVYGEARGTGTAGVHGDGGTVGRGIIAQADASTPAYSAMRIIPQDADPTAATSDGEVIWHASHRTLRTCVAGYGYRSAMAMGPGSALYVAASQAYNSVEVVTGVDSLLLQLDCLESEGTGVFGGAVQITFSCDVRSEAGTATYLSILVTDTTNSQVIADYTGGGTAATAAFLIGLPTNEWQRSVTFGLTYDPGLLGSYGDMSITIEVSSTPTDIEIRNATATIVGTF